MRSRSFGGGTHHKLICINVAVQGSVPRSGSVLLLAVCRSTMTSLPTRNAGHVHC
jgi:hypothetical protein